MLYPLFCNYIVFEKLNIMWYNISVADKHCTLKGKG